MSEKDNNDLLIDHQISVCHKRITSVHVEIKYPVHLLVGMSVYSYQVYSNNITEY
jgi:hypothetical protein